MSNKNPPPDGHRGEILKLDSMDSDFADLAAAGSGLDFQ